jgi:hypothetical protein
MPCYHNLESYLHAYIDGAALASAPKALLFQSYSRATGQLTGNPLPQANAYAMIQRRARAAEITTRIGNHTFRATGVTAYLKNGGTLERAGANGEPRQHAHNAAVRPPRRGSDARRGGEDTCLTDHLANRQTAGLGGDHSELNAKLDAIARHFDLGWLIADGVNPLQLLWRSRDAIATNELLNFGDAVENFEKVDADWLREQVSLIKTRDEGNRAGAIFELLGLNFYLSADNKVVPTPSSNPGYDGVVELPDQSSLLVSIKNHGMTSYERFFQANSKELDDQFKEWLKMHRWSGVELRILCSGRLDTTEWSKLDLPLNFHPAAIRASAGFTPCGAGGATCDRRSWSGLRSRSRVVERLAA